MHVSQRGYSFAVALFAVIMVYSGVAGGATSKADHRLAQGLHTSRSATPVAPGTKPAEGQVSVTYTPLLSSWAGNWSGWPVQLADIDGNGWTDLCSAMGTANGLYAYCGRGYGNATFSPTYTTTHVWAGNWSGWPVQLTDLNGDGLADLCSAKGTASGLYAYCGLGNGLGQFSAYVVTQWAGNWDGWPAQFTDLNGDGRADLCSALGTANGMYAYCSLGNGTGRFNRLYLTTRWAGNWSVWPAAFTDLNGDGRADLCSALGTASGLYSYCALGDGSGQFSTAHVTTQWPGNWSGWPAQFADITGDGRAELCSALGTTSGHYTYCGLGQGNAQFGPSTLINVWTGNWSGWLAQLEDLNNDGWADLCSALGTAGGLLAYCTLN